MTTKPENIPATLLKQEELAAEFQEFPERISTYLMDISTLEVSNDETAIIAKTNIDIGKTILEQLETVRKVLKQPYMETGKQIDSYSKMHKEKLEKAVTGLRVKMTSFLEIGKAQAEAIAKQERKKLEIINRKREDENKAYRRIASQLHVRLYGGSFETKDGKVFHMAGCKTTKDCDELQDFVKKGFPDPESYEFVSEEMVKLEAKTFLDIAKVYAEIVKGSEDNIALLRTKSENKSKEASDDIETERLKSENKENKKIDNSISEAKKGLKKTLTFEIEDESLVPVDYKTVDKSKIKSWQSENKDTISEILEKGKQPIPGIRFSYENVYSNR